jgi:hypothetical protein
MPPSDIANVEILDKLSTEEAESDRWGLDHGTQLRSNGLVYQTLIALTYSCYLTKHRSGPNGTSLLLLGLIHLHTKVSVLLIYS